MFTLTLYPLIICVSCHLLYFLRQLLLIGGINIMKAVYENSRDQSNILCWEKKNDAYFAHYHQTLEFVYVTAGILDIAIDGKKYSISSDTLICIPSFSIHSFSTPEFSRAYFLVIPIEKISSIKKYFVNKKFKSIIIQKEKLLKDIKPLFIAMSKQYKKYDESQSNQTQIIMQGYAYAFLGLLLTNLPIEEITQSKNTKLTYQIILYFQRNYMNPYTLQQLSEIFGYSPSQFSRIFNKNFGCSINEYISQLRCSHATLLLADNLTISEIAMKVGFSSERTFYRAFKKYYHISPKQYSIQNRSISREVE